jgi:hypothetical protein
MWMGWMWLRRWWRKRSLTGKEATILLQSTSLGAFGRYLHLNIDSKGRVGPLTHPGPDHKNLLPQYHHVHFGGDLGDVPTRDYLPALGEVTQQVSYCYPICWRGIAVKSKCEMEFEQLASNALEAFRLGVDNGMWIEPRGILGEQNHKDWLYTKKLTQWFPHSYWRYNRKGI